MPFLKEFLSVCITLLVKISVLCIGFAWPGFGTGRVQGWLLWESGRSSSQAQQSQWQTAPLLTNGKHISYRGSTSGITGLQKDKTSGKQQLERRVTLCEREHPAGTKVREEEGLGPPALFRVWGDIANWE